MVSRIFMNRRLFLSSGTLAALPLPLLSEEAKEAALRHSRAPVYGDDQSGSGLLKKV